MYKCIASNQTSHDFTSKVTTLVVFFVVCVKDVCQSRRKHRDAEAQRRCHHHALQEKLVTAQASIQEPVFRLINDPSVRS